MGTQQFYLKWNNHQSNMLTVFDQLLTNEALVDVTLACEGLSLKAHKMILSACSPFFQSLFLENPCQHPIVIMKDMKYTDLKAVVDFMYRGEVNVSQDQLTALLKTAETLKVKGLAEVAGDNRPEGAEDTAQEEINQPHSVSVPQASPLSETQSRTESPSFRRKRSRMRKRSLSDSNRSDSEDQVPSKIKEPDSPEIIEEVTPEVDSSNDVHQRLLPASHPSSSQVPSSHPSPSHPSPSQPQISHSKSQVSTHHTSHHDSSPMKSHTSLIPVHSQQSTSINVEEPHMSSQQDYGVEPPNILEQLPKLMEQIMTTENISVLSDHSSQGPTLPSTSTALAIPTTAGLPETQSIHPAAGSCDNQTLLPCSLPYETSTSSHISQDDDHDVKPGVLMSYEEPPMSPMAGPSHQDSSSSMMMYMDTSGVPAIPGPSTSYQIEQTSQQRQPQDLQPAPRNREREREKNFPCPICNEQFSSLTTLSKHAMNFHPGSKMMYQCEICDRYFASKSNLNRHMKIHENFFPYACQFCPRKFLYVSQLNEHLRKVHSLVAS